MMIAIWQVSIFILIVVAAACFGRWGLRLTVGASVIWTLVAVFTYPLMLLQFVTIYFAAEFAGKIIRKPKPAPLAAIAERRAIEITRGNMEPEINEEKETIIGVALLIVGGLIAGCLYLIDNNVFTVARGSWPVERELSYQKLAVTVLFPYFVISVIRLLRFVWRLIK